MCCDVLCDAVDGFWGVVGGGQSLLGSRDAMRVDFLVNGTAK
jgi:hypothetical protein